MTAHDSLKLDLLEKDVDVIRILSDLITTSVLDGFDRVRVNVEAGIVSGTFTQRGLVNGGAITVHALTTAWILLPYSITPINTIVLHNYSDDGTVILYNYADPGVGVSVGVRLGDGQSQEVELSEDIPLYVRALAGTASLTLEEIG